MIHEQGASPDGDRATDASHEAPAGLRHTVGIPSAERRQIVAFLTWWAEDQGRQAETTTDYDKEIEFAIRAEALADAARDILYFGDTRHASAGEADRPKRGATRGSVHEHATGEAGDAQGTQP